MYDDIGYIGRDCVIRVAVVDDELPIRDELAAYPWESMNACFIGSAANGRSGLELIKDTHPDLLLLDIIMPGMSGLELLKNIKAESMDLNVVILSYYGDYEYLRQAIWLGACDYVLKSNLCVDEIVQLLLRIYPTEIMELSNYRVEVRNAIRLIETHLGEAITQASIGEQVGLSAKYFGRIFLEATGKKFQEYLLERRIAEAQRLLSCTNLRVYEVGLRVGIPNYRYFTQQFKTILGYTPTDYKRREGR